MPIESTQHLYNIPGPQGWEEMRPYAIKKAHTCTYNHLLGRSPLLAIGLVWIINKFSFSRVHCIHFYNTGVDIYSLWIAKIKFQVNRNKVLARPILAPLAAVNTTNLHHHVFIKSYTSPPIVVFYVCFKVSREVSLVASSF